MDENLFSGATILEIDEKSFITGQTIVIDGGVLACLSSEAGRECNKGQYECDRNAAIAKQWFVRTYGPLTEEGRQWIEELKEHSP